MENFKKPFNKKKITFTAAFIVLVFALFIHLGLKPVSGDSSIKTIVIESGDGFHQITERLDEKNLVRSSFTFKLFSFLSGSARKFKPGVYELSESLRGEEIIKKLVKGREEVEVIIREGLSVYDIDSVLGSAKVIEKGELIAYNEKRPVEGKLFPDTYKFFVGSKVEDVIAVLIRKYEKEISSLIKEKSKEEEILILASLIENEVPDLEERKVVAGILKKRLTVGVALQVDSSICYLKKKTSLEAKSCYPLTPLDMKIDSPYNTYKFKGLPPGPISSPGVSAVRAVLEPKKSPYWYFLSDPRTHKTIFAESLEEHNQNILVYLKN